MSDYTPDTEEVKIHYAYPYRDDLKDTKRAEFDRWLEAHDRKVIVAAFRLIASEMYAEDREYIESRALEIENGGTL